MEDLNWRGQIAAVNTMALNKNDCLDAAVSALKEAGIYDYTVAIGSKHAQVRWTAKNGRARIQTIPLAAGDFRSAPNTRRDVRQKLREDGYIIDMPQDEKPVARPPTIAERVYRLECAVDKLRQLLGGNN